MAEERNLTTEQTEELMELVLRSRFSTGTSEEAERILDIAAGMT